MREKTRVNVLILCDFFLINCSIFMAYILRINGQFTNIFAEYLRNGIKFAILATFIKIGFYFYFKLYSSLWRYAGTYEMLSVVGATSFSNVVMFVVAIPLHVPRNVLIITAFSDMILVGGIRFTYRVGRRVLKYKFKIPRHMKSNMKKVLVVGGGEAGSIIIKELKANPKLRSIPVGVIDDDRKKTGRKISGITIIGDRSRIVETVQKYNVDEIIIATPSASKTEINKIYLECLKTRCKIRTLPSVCQLIDGSVCIQKVRDVNLEDLLGREQVNLDSEEISSCIMNQVVLVTGAGGSIGSELCRQISRFDPLKLIILDNYENNAYDIQNELKSKYPKLDLITIIANIREKQRLDNIFRNYRPDVVFHAAAHKHVPLMETNPTEAIKNNVFGTQNVAECADKYKAKKFVLISTDKAVNPTNIMGATKRIAEMIIQSLNQHSETEFVAVRFGNVLGSNGSVIPLFIKQIEEGGPVTVTHPEVTRYFMTIPEAAQLVIQAGAMAKGGEIFVLDMGEPIKIADLAENLIKLMGFVPEEEIKIAFTGLRPGEKLYEELLLAEEGLERTKNFKIFIAPPIFTDHKSLKSEINTLNEIILRNSDDVVSHVLRIVPTYKFAQ